MRHRFLTADVFTDSVFGGAAAIYMRGTIVP